MPDRTYNQYCGVARALDLVGERWALLVVRELTLGGKRFTDLRDGLPGIGTNVLATRLRAARGRRDRAEAAARPARRDTTVYVLTDYGRRLVPAMLALGRWGAESMGEPRDPEQAVRSEWFAVALHGVLPRGGRGRRRRDDLELDLAGRARSALDDRGRPLRRRPPATRRRRPAHDCRRRGAARVPAARTCRRAPEAEGDEKLLGRLPEIFPFGFSR